MKKIAVGNLFVPAQSGDGNMNKKGGVEAPPFTLEYHEIISRFGFMPSRSPLW